MLDKGLQRTLVILLVSVLALGIRPWGTICFTLHYQLPVIEWGELSTDCLPIRWSYFLPHFPNKLFCFKTGRKVGHILKPASHKLENLSPLSSSLVSVSKVQCLGAIIGIKMQKRIPERNNNTHRSGKVPFLLSYIDTIPAVPLLRKGDMQ